eukprot:350895-Chlamydomonas_euryale.AAC.9
MAACRCGWTGVVARGGGTPCVRGVRAGLWRGGGPPCVRGVRAVRGDAGQRWQHAAVDGQGLWRGGGDHRACVVSALFEVLLDSDGSMQVWMDKVCIQDTVQRTRAFRCAGVGGRAVSRRDVVHYRRGALETLALK